MNQLWIIIAIEAFVIVLIALGVLLVLSGRKKKRITTEIEQLLDEVEKNGPQRKQWLEQFLSCKHPLTDEEVSELSTHFIEAENTFYKQFIKQQLTQSSLAGFHTQLGVLLDQYLTLMPYKNEPMLSADVAPEAQPIEPAPLLNEPETALLDTDDQETAAESAVQETDDEFGELDDTENELLEADINKPIPELSSEEAIEETEDEFAAFDEDLSSPVVPITDASPDLEAPTSDEMTPPIESDDTLLPTLIETNETSDENLDIDDDSDFEEYHEPSSEEVN